MIRSIALIMAMLGVCRAGLLHAPIVQTYVSAVPSVLTHSRVAIPAAIPTTVSEVITSARTVPEHRFTSTQWEQPTSHVIPAVRQYTVRSDIPVAVRSVSLEPVVHYESRQVSVPTTAALTLPTYHTFEPIVQQAILKR